MHELTSLMAKLRELYSEYREFDYQAQIQADARAEELLKGFASDVLVDPKLQNELFPVNLKPLGHK